MAQNYSAKHSQLQFVPFRERHSCWISNLYMQSVCTFETPFLCIKSDMISQYVYMDHLLEKRKRTRNVYLFLLLRASQASTLSQLHTSSFSWSVVFTQLFLCSAFPDLSCSHSCSSVQLFLMSCSHSCSSVQLFLTCPVHTAVPVFSFSWPVMFTQLFQCISCFVDHLNSWKVTLLPTSHPSPPLSPCTRYKLKKTGTVNRTLSLFAQRHSASDCTKGKGLFP